MTFGPELLAEPEYRVEGHLKVTGRAHYAADVRARAFPGPEHVYPLRKQPK